MKVLLLGAVLAMSGCSTYSHMEQIGENEFYLSGHKGMLGLTRATVDICHRSKDNTLKCESAIKYKKKSRK